MSIPGPDSQIPTPAEQVPPPYAGSQGAPAWPPPPTQSTGAWPPPAYGGGPAALFQMPFNHIVGRTNQGAPNDMRVGTMWVTSDGLMFEGKAVIPAETRVPIALVCLLFRIGVVLALVIMEYAFRKDRQLFVPWSQVQKIVFNKKRNQALFVFDAPNFSRGTMKKFSLVTNILPGYFDAFATTVHPFVPDRFSEGNIEGIPFWLRIALVVLILVMIVAVAYVVINANHGGP